MHPARPAAALAALALLAACASDPAPTQQPVAVASATPAATAASAAKQVCHKEQPIGSLIPVTRCETADEAANRQAVETVRQSVYSHTMPNKAPGP